MRKLSTVKYKFFSLETENKRGINWKLKEEKNSVKIRVIINEIENVKY